MSAVVGRVRRVGVVVCAAVVVGVVGVAAGGCKDPNDAIAACVAGGNPRALCECLSKTTELDDVRSAFGGGGAPALGKIAVAAGECAKATGALAAEQHKHCIDVGWDKSTCACVEERVAALDPGAIAMRATDKQVVSFSQVAQAMAAGQEGTCALSGGTLESDVAVACGDDKQLCACTKAALAPGKVKPPDSLDALRTAVVAARDACAVQAPEVRVGVVKSCMADAGKKAKAKDCECAATKFLSDMNASEVMELKASGWTTDALQRLQNARAQCKRRK